MSPVALYPSIMQLIAFKIVDMCERLFGSEEQLFEHLRKVHVGLRSDKTFQGQCLWANCSRVDQHFVKPYDLMSHIQVHVNVRPFECICGSRSKRQSDLRKHLGCCCRGKAFKWTTATWALFMARKGFSDDAITRILQLVQTPADILRVTEAQLREAQIDAPTCRLFLESIPFETREKRPDEISLSPTPSRLKRAARKPPKELTFVSWTGSNETVDLSQ